MKPIFLRTHMLADYSAIGAIWHAIQFLKILKISYDSINYDDHFVYKINNKGICIFCR